MNDLDHQIEEKILPFLTKETCSLLNENKLELKDIKWVDNESNIDGEFSNIVKKYCEIAHKKLGFDSLFCLKINTPDILLTFTKDDNEIKKKIELKSTKSSNGTLPGSMIRSLDPNIWTIVCKRNEINNSFELRYGRYHLGIEFSSHEKFQDRSPRPVIKFSNYQDSFEEPNTQKIERFTNFWQKYAESALNRVLNPQNHSWQDDLVKEIIRKVLENPDKFKDI